MQRFAEKFIYLCQGIIRIFEARYSLSLRNVDHEQFLTFLPRLRIACSDYRSWRHGEFMKCLVFRSEFVSLVSDADLTNIDGFHFLKSALTNEPKRIFNRMDVRLRPTIIIICRVEKANDI